MKKQWRLLAIMAATLTLISATACNSASKDSSSASNSTGSSSEASSTEEPKVAEVEKPEKITIMMDTAFGSMVDSKTWESFQNKFKELTGIEMVMVKPDHQKYYEQVSLAFTSGSPPDILEVGSTYYPSYATNGALWDMTETWNNSELKASGIVEEKYVDALKIDNVLYGFPMAKGNGTITYVRKDWLDNLGLSIPKTYDEFIAMLRAFTFDDPDGNGVNDTYGLTAAGLINTETPYAIYLREFYQDAIPDFYLKDGKYVDGMGEPAMLEALKRMKDAYSEGLVDKEIITNKTSTARDKFYASQVGTFNYWAGNWNVTLENNLKASNANGLVVPMEPIMGTRYIERPPTAMAITSAAQNPEGIFKYLIEYSHDGGEGQLLFTRGIEGENYEKSADGNYKQLPDPENPDKLFEKTFYAPELSITTFADPVKFDDRLVNSLKMFNQHSDIASIPQTSEIISQNLSELIPIKGNAIANCVTGDLSPEDAIKQYQKDGAIFIEAILADLNK